MNADLLIFSGYGLYIWPAFLFTFLICLFLYIKTVSELRKQEKKFQIAFHQTEAKKIEFKKRKGIKKTILSVN